MQIQINSDSSIERHEPLSKHVETVVKNTLNHFSEHITRVEVHLSDTNGQKSGDADNRCLMEVRLQGHQPIAVSDHAATLHQSIQGAADKLKRSLESTLGRLSDSPKGRQIIPDEPENNLNE